MLVAQPGSPFRLQFNIRSEYSDMNSQSFSYLLVALCVVALAFGQIIFKLVGTRISGAADLLTHVTALALLAAGVGLYAASTVAWIIALRTLPLTHAYMFMSIGFILVPIAAHFFLGEPLTGRLMFGSLIIILGILVAVS
jgi:drug/metabolite transporter (DMT)-like permease